MDSKCNRPYLHLSGPLSTGIHKLARFTTSGVVWQLKNRGVGGNLFEYERLKNLRFANDIVLDARNGKEL